MSIKLAQLVWRTKIDLTPHEHHVLACLANFANDKQELHCCPSTNTIALQCRITQRHTYRIIKDLCARGILIKKNRQTDNQRTLTNEYSINEEILGGRGDQWSGVGVTNGQGGGDTRSPNNYIDNINKINIYSEDAKEIINFLRKITGRNYQPNQPTIKLISERLKEGVTVLQCRKVILKKFDEWGHDKVMEKYLRPSTLFNKTNLHMKYLPELVTEERKQAIKQGIDKF